MKILATRNPDDRHLDMLKDYVAVSGVDRNSVESSIVLGGTEQLQNWGWMMVYQKPWPVAAAGLFIGLESQFLDICKKIVPALHQHYGYKARAREIRFFEEHVYADEIHGSKGFAIVEKYCTTPELQAAAIKQVEDSHDPALALYEQYLLVRAARQGRRHAGAYRVARVRSLSLSYPRPLGEGRVRAIAIRPPSPLSSPRGRGCKNLRRKSA